MKVTRPPVSHQPRGGYPQNQQLPSGPIRQTSPAYYLWLVSYRRRLYPPQSLRGWVYLSISTGVIRLFDLRHIIRASCINIELFGPAKCANSCLPFEHEALGSPQPSRVLMSPKKEIARIGTSRSKFLREFSPAQS